MKLRQNYVYIDNKMVENLTSHKSMYSFFPERSDQENPEKIRIRNSKIFWYDQILLNFHRKELIYEVKTR